MFGARPGKALVITDEEGLLKTGLTEEAILKFAEYAAKTVPTGKNLRGSAAYRTKLVQVECERALKQLGGMA